MEPTNQEHGLIVLQKPVEQQPQEQIATTEKPGELTRDTLADYQQDLMVKHAPLVLPDLFKAIRKAIKSGDEKVMKMAAEIYGYTKGAGGITVINNLQQNNVGGSAGQETVYFEGIIRRLDEQDQSHKAPDIIDIQDE